MKNKPARVPLHEKFDVTYVISFKGVTRSNGWRMVTPSMIIDKIADVLNNMVIQGNLVEFTIKVEPNSKEDIQEKNG